MVSGSLLIHGPPVISGAGRPTRVENASGPRETARTTTAAAIVAVASHADADFMVTTIALPERFGVTPLSILLSGPVHRGLDTSG
jgi:hypothetical protein